MTRKTFASDNYSGVHPLIMEALVAANAGHQPSYGADDHTARATELFRREFGPGTQVFFVYNGTGANVLGLKSLTRSFQSILCSELAHINVDESTAPEVFTGCKLIPLPHVNGKITPEEIVQRIRRVGDMHHPQAKVVSISQTTEYSTVYSAEEVTAISRVAKQHGLFLHMDGSRISNAAASLGQPFRQFTRDAGVDVLSFGGTKNGLMVGEAVVFFNAEAAEYFQYLRKQGMQLHSKMRFISAQFAAFLENGLWRENALHANRMARRLADGLASCGVEITHPVQANGVFALLPADVIPALQDAYYFYVWNERTSEVRLMCSFDTTEEDVDGFVAAARKILGDR